MTGELMLLIQSARYLDQRRGTVFVQKQNERNTLRRDDQISIFQKRLNLLAYQISKPESACANKGRCNRKLIKEGAIRQYTQIYAQVFANVKDIEIYCGNQAICSPNLL